MVYHSRKFSPTETNCHTTEHKMLAVVDTLCHFHHLLLGRKFKLCTDHRPLVYFFNKASSLSAR